MIGGRGPLDGQARFLAAFDERCYKAICFVGGVGSGKSHLGAHLAIELAALQPDVRGWISANTYPQLWQSTLTALYKVAKSYGVPIHPARPESAAKKKALYLWNRVEVLIRSAEDYQNWDGTEIGWAWLDEAKTMAAGVWPAINERLRDARAEYRVIFPTTTPLGNNWLCDLQEDPRVCFINGHTKDNFYNPEDYFETLCATMGEELARQQLAGEFLNVYEGNCYPNFSRQENCGEYSIDCGSEIVIGVDFNTDPGMHAYAMQSRGPEVYVLSEIYLRGGDTPRLAREIESQFGVDRVIIHPDAAGGQRHTTGTSDFAILREHGFKLRGRAKNPAIKDRVNAVNGRILNARGERLLHIDKSCKLLRTDLERCTWPILLSGSYHGPLTHPGAAIGYAIEYQFPSASTGFAVSLPRPR